MPRKKAPKYPIPPPIEHTAFGGTQVHINHYDEETGEFLYMTVETKSEPPTAG